MIEFVTLLLGLVAGTQAVEVSVSDQVAMVEIRLDGRFVGGLTRPPWFLNCDFGAELAPHELEAIAYDFERRQLQTIRQWVNLPRERSEARLALVRLGEAPPAARLIWTALDHSRPADVRLTFDGQALQAGDLEAVALPPHDPGSLHLLRAELLFSETEQANAELVFGGTYGDEVATELTAVVLFADRRRLPEPARMAGWFEKRGRPLEVVAVERGPANLLIVRERSAATLDGLFELWEHSQRQRRSAKVPPIEVPVLDEKDRVRFVFPTIRREPAVAGQGLAPLDVEQVPVSGDLEITFRKAQRSRLPGGIAPPKTELHSLFDALTRARYPEDQPAPEHQLADAVVIAGLVAAAGDRPRAVLLIRSGNAADTSRFSARDARHYLQQLRVPLAVWSIAGAGDAPSPWGEGPDVSGLTAMNRALADLREKLQAQVVVWIAGAHLSHEIELTDQAVGLRAEDARVPERKPRERETDEPLTTPLGPYRLRSHVEDPGLIDVLRRVAEQHARLYGERFGLPVEQAGGEIVLFDEREDYRRFILDPDRRDVEVHGNGYFYSPRTVVMHRGRLSRDQLAATLIHELTHLLNQQILWGKQPRAGDLPAWLDEGMADDLALSFFDSKRQLVAEPLSRGNLHYGPRITGLLLEIERQTAPGGEAPPLPMLLAMDRDAFMAGDSVLRYSLSAFWVRYWLSVPASRDGLRAYLASVAAGGSAHRDALAAWLGREWPQLEQGFRGWLLKQRARFGI